MEIKQCNQISSESCNSLNGGMVRENQVWEWFAGCSWRGKNQTGLTVNSIYFQRCQLFGAFQRSRDTHLIYSFNFDGKLVFTDVFHATLWERLVSYGLSSKIE